MCFLLPLWFNHSLIRKIKFCLRYLTFYSTMIMQKTPKQKIYSKFVKTIDTFKSILLMIICVLCVEKNLDFSGLSHRLCAPGLSTQQDQRTAAPITHCSVMDLMREINCGCHTHTLKTHTHSCINAQPSLSLAVWCSD